MKSDLKVTKSESKNKGPDGKDRNVEITVECTRIINPKKEN
jgi:hypothetical protein